MGEDELATIEDCIRCAYVECLIDEDGERRLLAELARLRAVEAAAVEAAVACSVCGGAGAYEAEYRRPDGRACRQVEPCGDCGVLVNREWRRTIPLRDFLGRLPPPPGGQPAEDAIEGLYGPDEGA